MTTVRIEQRSKKSLTLIIDHGIDKVTKKRKADYIALDTLDWDEAEIERLKVLTKLAAGNYVKSNKSTLSEYIDYWFKTPTAKGLGSKTIEGYKQCAESRIKPWIGHIRLIKLTRDDLYKFCERIIDEGNLSNKKTKDKIGIATVEKNYRFIRRILNHAVFEDGILENNVALRMKLPEIKLDNQPKKKEKVKVLSTDEVIKLENDLKENENENLVTVALRTGMRREELLALRDDDIDAENHTAEIDEALIYTKENGFEFKETKNKKNRIIEITDIVLSAIRNQQLINKANKLRLGEKYIDTGLIFCNADGTNLHPDRISEWFPKFCVKRKISRLTFHCLRHTHASHLLAAGEDISYVSKRLGHSSIEVTYKLYFHFIPREKREALQKLDKRFSI
ncbi:site-specific integrase [Anaerosinus massiliensis]|uniref:site-specific integrase n=1 Tax=Massilibacillus massiliensis TaxID=1806837 RepID=UPI000B07D5CF|nr:tyrosine-type recombinase/integrase [Massilibacillus massiliensis]